ncbi:MAG TPA: hypothetical protein DEG96_09490 [Candidatus Atribacteria bacterium]|nr:hypothetical protein [Candidatus Atribacteria bacterium]
MDRKLLLWFCKELLKISLLYEKFKGVSFDYFISYSNLIKEILPIQPRSSIRKTWINYRIHNMMTNIYRKHPYLFSGFDKIIGVENIMEWVKEGGILLSFHYGDYRYGPRAVAQLLLKRVPKLKFIMLVDQESYNEEIKLKYKKVGVEFIIAEQVNIGLKLYRLISNNNWVYVYLDGNTGVGNDSSPINVNFLSSKIYIRSGLFRLMGRLHKPIIPVITRINEGKRELIIYPAVFIETNKVQEGAEKCFKYFREEILKSPEHWRLWYRHHWQVINWATNISFEKNEKAMNIFCKVKKLNLRLGSEGNVYKTIDKG